MELLNCYATFVVSLILFSFFISFGFSQLEQVVPGYRDSSARQTTGLCGQFCDSLPLLRGGLNGEILFPQFLHSDSKANSISSLITEDDQRNCL